MFLFRRGTGRLTPEHARTRTGDGTAVLLDVREAQEWRAGHAPGAVHLSLSRPPAGAALPPGLRDAGRRRHQPAGHHGRLPGLARHPLGPAVSLDRAVIGPFVATAVLGAWDGKRLAVKVHGPRLQRVFAVVLLAVAAFMLADGVT